MVIECSRRMILVNMLPVIFVAELVTAGLKFIPEKMISGFQVFAKALISVTTIGFMASVFSSLPHLWRSALTGGIESE